jgi:hypothetical protein
MSKKRTLEEIAIELLKGWVDLSEPDQLPREDLDKQIEFLRQMSIRAIDEYLHSGNGTVTVTQGNGGSGHIP